MDTIRYGYDTMRCETIQCDTMLRETIRIRYGYDTITDTIRCNTIRYDTTRYATLHYDTIQWFVRRYGYDTNTIR